MASSYRPVFTLQGSSVSALNGYNYILVILPYIAEKDFVVSSSSSPEQTEGEISIQTSINTTTFSGGVCMMARPACMTARYIDLDTIIGLHECYS